MMKAYVQISVDGSQEQEIYEQMKQLEQVEEVHIIYGEWDMLAKLSLESPEALGTFVLNHIRSIPGVRLTSTMIVAK